MRELLRILRVQGFLLGFFKDSTGLGATVSGFRGVYKYGVFSATKGRLHGFLQGMF